MSDLKLWLIVYLLIALLLYVYTRTDQFRRYYFTYPNNVNAIMFAIFWPFTIFLICFFELLFIMLNAATKVYNLVYKQRLFELMRNIITVAKNRIIANKALMRILYNVETALTILVFLIALFMVAKHIPSSG